MDGEKQIDGPLKRMPRGDATKFLPEKCNRSTEKIAFNCLVDMGPSWESSIYAGPGGWMERRGQRGGGTHQGEGTEREQSGC